MPAVQEPRFGEFLETVVGGPPDGWKLGHISVLLKHDGTRISVEAWCRGAFAIHEVEWSGGGAARLTHAPTGLKIWTFASVEDAAEAAETIEPLADWASIKKELPLGTELYPKVREVFDKIDARREPPGEYEEEDGNEDDDEDREADCGRWIDGRLTKQCRLAGTEWCDWDCPIGIPQSLKSR